MKNTIINIINYFTGKTRTLFLLDGLGAAMTVFYLFFVLRRFYDNFGMPTPVLTYLSVIGLIFCVYSMTCFFLLKRNWIPFLVLIGIGNLMYCALTLLLLFIYFNDLTKWGVLYFSFEIVVILLIVYMEFRVVSALKNHKEA